MNCLLDGEAYGQAIEKRIQSLRSREARLDQSFIYERAIDRATYQAHRDRIRDEIAVAELELGDARFDELEVEGVLAFAEYVFGNLSTLWMSAELADKRRLQEAVFPTGLLWDGDRFGTAVTLPAFSWLQEVSHNESGVASPTIPSWNQIAEFLKSMQQLRDSTGFAA